MRNDKSKIYKRRKKAVKVVGFTFIAIGILVLFYPFYTNFIVSRIENKILSSWEYQKETIMQEIERNSQETEIRGGFSNEISINAEKETDKEKDKNKKVDGEILKAEDLFPLKIVIPKIELEWIVNEGSDSKTLKKGPGHISETPLPGEVGRCTISGHRTTYGAPFNRIDELEAGDIIYLESKKGDLFLYVVKNQIIVDPDDVYILKSTGKRELLLTACTPKFSAVNRLVVVAEYLDFFPFKIFDSQQ